MRSRSCGSSTGFTVRPGKGARSRSRRRAIPQPADPPRSVMQVVIWNEYRHERDDEEVRRIYPHGIHGAIQRGLDGMGLVVLHSGHHSRIFRRLMGTSCNLAWRETPGGERERLWVVDPAHAICAGLAAHVELPASEMYGEPFDVPPPDELVLISWFQGGEVFRSGCCYRRGRGRIFYL